MPAFQLRGEYGPCDLAGNITDKAIPVVAPARTVNTIHDPVESHAQ
jgi:hypothetical protein